MASPPPPARSGRPPRRWWWLAAAVAAVAVLAVAVATVVGRQAPTGAEGSPAPASPSPAQTVVPGPDVVVAAAGDIACAADDDPGPDGCQQAATAQVVRSLDPDLVLPLGDEQYPDGALGDYRGSYDASWGAFKEITRPVPGNHDFDSGGEGYFTYFGDAAGDPSRGYYSFDAGAWHVVALNTECSDDGCLARGGPQETWLRQDLAVNATRCTLAFMHRPRYSSDVEHGDAREVADLWRTLQDGGADVVLAGHAHDYERFRAMDADGRPAPDGIRSFVVGTGGKSLYALADLGPRTEASHDDGFGVLRLGLHADGYDWRFVSAAGSSYTDSGSGTCR